MIGDNLAGGSSTTPAYHSNVQPSAPWSSSMAEYRGPSSNTQEATNPHTYTHAHKPPPYPFMGLKTRQAETTQNQQGLPTRMK